MNEECPYCHLKCLYKDHAGQMENLINTIIPIETDQFRYTDIFLIDWTVDVKVWEGDILIGNIYANSLRNMKIFHLANYFCKKLPVEADEYIYQLFKEIKLYYDTPELKDGEHPITIKFGLR